MLLIGQYDSPFVRRVGIALTLYGMVFEHAPWSTFGEADKIAKFNPLRRVPTLVMDDGAVFMDSASILMVLDDMAGPERAVLARRGEDGRDSLRIAAMAAGVAVGAAAGVAETRFGPAMISPTSSPEQKAGSAPVTTTQRTSGSAEAARKAASSWS